MHSATASSCLLWFQLDLRLRDNPALQAALAGGSAIIPVYIFDENGEDKPLGGASRWWLHHALKDLSEQLQAHGLRLIIRHGDAQSEILKLCRETNSQIVYANTRYEPAASARQQRIVKALEADGVYADFNHNATLLFPPSEVLNKSGSPFQVFTPYWKTCLARGLAKPRKTDFSKLICPSRWPQSDTIDSLRLLPAIKWDAAFYEHWTPTREGALARLKHFVLRTITGYSEGRDIPDADSTSRMSPWLHFGQIGVREIVSALNHNGQHTTADGEKFLSEIGWRDFSYYLLHHNPSMPREPLREAYAAFPWSRNARLLHAWQRGQTGYPLVDAGMRQLWNTGWMHNRVRMVVASFLVKNLLQPWQDGAEWFWDTLVDADLAANSQGWQWSAGCGADAAPYFRVFNPVTQGERFDPEGAFIRRWIPELEKLPPKYIHRPWDAPAELLRHCGVTLGEQYPLPIIGLMEGRIRALQAYDAFSTANKAAKD